MPSVWCLTSNSKYTFLWNQKPKKYNIFKFKIQKINYATYCRQYGNIVSLSLFEIEGSVYGDLSLVGVINGKIPISIFAVDPLSSDTFIGRQIWSWNIQEIKQFEIFYYTTISPHLL